MKLMTGKSSPMYYFLISCYNSMIVRAPVLGVLDPLGVARSLCSDERPYKWALPFDYRQAQKHSD